MKLFRPFQPRPMGRGGNSASSNAHKHLPVQSTHIGSLPNELVLRIFELVHREIFLIPSLSSYQVPPEPSYHTWIQFLHVCVQWRNLILSAPYLWYIAAVKSDVHPLELCLELSGSSPLEVRFYDAPGPLISQALSLLQSRTDSIRSLVLYASNLRGDDPAMVELFSLDLPELEELCVMPVIALEEGHDRRLVGMHHYPRLRRLTLLKLPLPLDIANLHLLHLHECALPPTYDELVLILEHCPALVELRLHCSLTKENALTPPQDLSPRCRRARLEQLRILRVGGLFYEFVYTLLAHIDAPALSDLHVWTYYTPTQLPDSANERPLRPFLPGGPCVAFPRFPSDGRVTVRLSFEDGEWLVLEALELPSPALTNRSPRKAHLRSRLVDTRPDVASPICRDVAELFAHTPVVELVVRPGTGESRTMIEPASWAELFASMPHLEEIRFIYDGDAAAMWQGLQQASVGRTDLCSPHLKTVCIWRDASAEDGVLLPYGASLLLVSETLRMRQERGAKLGLLWWELGGLLTGEGESSERRARLEEKLCPFVHGLRFFESPSEYKGKEAW
ncbi:hypothetical protein C8Q77DRAFT_133298 [Trametes polyzona]|nr:hypothetical protein C8Q77DRAFT_133298 [Trametes polyzona]